MWKEYSASYIKNNRSSSFAVMIAAFIASLFLSLLCNVFYNMWKYEMESIILENTFTGQSGALAESEAFNRELWTLFLVIVVMASFSLIVIIHNSFAISMNTRIHQFGILSSIGATPRQIRTCLLQEAAVLCAVPVLSGNALGMLLTKAIIQMTNVLLGNEISGRHEAVFGCHPLVIGMTFLAAIVTIGISAWLPARELSRLSPLEAIRNTGEFQLKRKKNACVLKFLFGVEGELAGNALKAQRKALRTASLSLVLSFMAFTMMQCFFVISAISTRETYFERYQDAWDIMVTVKGTDVEAFGGTEALEGLLGVESVVVYQKAAAKRLITEEEMSEDMKAFGGFSHASAEYATKVDGGFVVNAPIIIMDDESFLDYCEQIGIPPRLDGVVIRNRICDVTNPDFRHPVYMPYLKEDNASSILKRSGQEESCGEEIPVLSYTGEVPVLREEYATLDYYELVHFMPMTLWKEMKERIGGEEEDSYIRILCRERETLEQLSALQSRMEQMLGQTYSLESENRIQEYETNNRQIQGMKVILGGFCVLLALIGIGNVFSNTLGFVRQRKREFARYMSVGLTPQGIWKMFCIEALVIAGRPVLLTFPLAVLVVGYLLKICYLEVGEFWAEAPYIPIGIFMTVVFGFVALAYYLGWRNVRKISLAEVLRDDTILF